MVCPRGPATFSIHLLTVALLGSGCSGGRTPEAIVVISIDTLRADHLGCYGYERATSPFLDQLADRSVLFEQAISTAPWTLPAHASLLTGLYPSSHRAVDADSAIASSAAHAAEIFQSAGFATGAVVTSFFVSGRYGFDRGFDRFEDFNKTSKATLRQKVRAEEAIDAAVDWLQSIRTRRFFLFLHLYDPHYDYNPPAEYRDLFDTGYRGERHPYWRYSYYRENPLATELLAHEISLYDGEIRYVDDQLKRFVDLLERMGLRKSVLLVITSDHGEEFFERGSWGHAHTLYDEQIRVPLLVSGAGVSGARRVTAQVRHIDLLPTLLDAVGLSIPSELPGENLWPLIQGRGRDRDPGGKRPALVETSRFGTNLVGIRHGGWKFITDFLTGREFLFDLSQDPGENKNLAPSEPRLATRLRSQTMSELEEIVPDLWMLQWLTKTRRQLWGELHTSGAFIAPSVDSEGWIDLQGARTILYRLEPGETLSFRVLPVDAKISMKASPTAGGEAVPVVLGATDQPATSFPVRISSRRESLHSQPSAPSSSAAVLWIEPSQMVSEQVLLDEEEKERLRALGYVVR